jgi:arylsulfatase A-like enzyme/Flp pilus assembly protein TadD
LGSLSVLLLAAACGADDVRPSVLLVTIDTLRADAVSAWGVEVGTTPVLDGLAAKGTRFAHASSVTPITLPTHASILTGLRPADHGLTVNGVSVSELPVSTLAERLAQQGYATGAFVSSTVLDRRFGLDAGFAHYDDDLVVQGGATLPTERRGDLTVDRALDWEGWSDSPYFAWVHLFDPHAPYAAPGGRSGTDRAAYLDEVRFVDQQLGRLIGGVRAASDGPVLVVVLSDHGEGLGQHGEETHSLLLHESTMHVPWVMAWLGDNPPAGFPTSRGEVREDAVSVLDVTPTVLDVLGLPAAARVEGVSVVHAQAGRALPLETRAPWFYYGFSALVGVRKDAEKIVGAPDAEAPGWSLTRPLSDPAELRPELVADHALRQLVRSAAPAVEASPSGRSESLAALGYFGNEAPAGTQGPLADPRTRMELIEGLNRANMLLVTGDASVAAAEAESLRSRYGEIPELLYMQGRIALERGDWRTAAEHFDSARSIRPTAALHVQAASALLRGVEFGEADPADVIARLDKALGIAPHDPQAIALRALVDVVAGRPADGLTRVEASLASRPRDAALLGVKRQALLALGRAAEAREIDVIMQELWPERATGR